MLIKVINRFKGLEFIDAVHLKLFLIVLRWEGSQGILGDDYIVAMLA